MRFAPLSSLPILVWAAIVFAIAWSSERYDDFAGLAAVMAGSHVLVWLGVRGDPRARMTRSRIVGVAIGGAIPTAACLLVVIPWVAGDGGLEALGRVVMMMFFGVPIGVAAIAVAIARAARGTAGNALARASAIVVGTTAIAWVLALAWLRGHPVESARELLVFPAVATAWLLLPGLELTASRRRA